MSRPLILLLGASMLTLAACKGSRRNTSNGPAPQPYVGNPYGFNNNGYGDPNFNRVNYDGNRVGGYDQRFDDEAFGVTGVNDRAFARRRSEVFVSPGDVLTLGQPRGGYGRGYSWESSLHERCTFERGFECPNDSNFRWLDGPRYVVPARMPRTLRITIRAFGGPPETIVLRRGPGF